MLSLMRPALSVPLIFGSEYKLAGSDDPSINGVYQNTRLLANHRAVYAKTDSDHLLYWTPADGAAAAADHATTDAGLWIIATGATATVARDVDSDSGVELGRIGGVVEAGMVVSGDGVQGEVTVISVDGAAVVLSATLTVDATTALKFTGAKLAQAAATRDCSPDDCAWVVLRCHAAVGCVGRAWAVMGRPGQQGLTCQHDAAGQPEMTGRCLAPPPPSSFAIATRAS